MTDHIEPNREDLPTDFLQKIVSEDVANGRNNGRVHTRFPPEPNGYLHIGHAKAISVDFEIANMFGGKCNLRFDDTNPVKEEQEYIDAIMRDIKWLGYDWEDRLYFASDYFEQLYEWARFLIMDGKAYVDDLSMDEIRDYRGTLTTPGKNSPYRDRSVEDNLDLFARMKAGEFPDGSRVLRAKIDMASPIINLRDPVMYRIRHATHPRTGDEWCIYPMYDWAHGQSDAIEGITHSLCSLEYVNHRPLYEWFLENIDAPSNPRQIEFGRFNMTYTVLSKRKLIQLVDEQHVDGWDDPRLPTLAGMRRRGYSPEAIRNLMIRTGVSTSNNRIEVEMLEHAVREDLNAHAPRAMAVLQPLKVIIENYPTDGEEWFEVATHPQDKANDEMRRVPFSRELWIEREDYMENAPRKFYRLSEGREVRFYGAYLITCQEAIKDEAGHVVALRCTYDPETRGGNAPDGRRVKGTIHWVSAAHAQQAECRLFEHLFTQEDPDDVPTDETFLSTINPDSKSVINAYLEPSLGEAAIGECFQFMRNGYFTVDQDSKSGNLVFNRTITLRDTWAKVKKGK